MFHVEHGASTLEGKGIIMLYHQLVGLSGFKGAGKDAAAYALSARLGYTRIAFADAVCDEVFQRFGIRLGEDDKDWPLPAYGLRSYRELLIEHAQERRAQNPDYWVDRVDAQVREYQKYGIRVVVTDVRMQNEIEWLRSMGGFHIWIHRPGVFSNGHVTEQDLSPLTDLTIVNDGDRERLSNLVTHAATHGLSRATLQPSFEPG
jgi:hypothetical protein